MQKLAVKDKKVRQYLKIFEQEYFILKSISQNLNLSTLIRWKAFLMLKKKSKRKSICNTSNRCIYSINRKRLNKLTSFSRHIYLKLIRSGQIFAYQKSSW